MATSSIAAGTIRLAPFTESDAFLFRDSASGGILFLVGGAGLGLGVSNTHNSRKKVSEKNTSESITSDVLISLSLPKNGSGEFIVKLPSPIVRPEDREKLLGLKYVKARSDTLKFWSFEKRS